MAITAYWAFSAFFSVMSAKTWSSHAVRSPSFDPKWWMTSPGETPAAAAIARTVVFANPWAANSLTAASRILCAVSGDELGERPGSFCGLVERMFNIKRMFNDAVNRVAVNSSQASLPRSRPGP
ncbi:Uncharacterised protein [Mycobacteroides abscessus subsp. abscessus]|nr:Uncharacterised protein [Mycobacteroides abscessus subsp. abscessus]